MLQFQLIKMAFKSTQWKEIDGEKWFKFNSKYDHFRYFWSNTFTLVLIVLLVMMMLYAYYNIEIIKKQPLTYYAEKASEIAGENLFFVCNQNGDFDKEFRFNSTSIWIIPKDKADRNIDINLSNANLSGIFNSN